MNAIHSVPPEIVIAQVETVAADIRIDAVKVGMLGDLITIEAVARALECLETVPIVIDPVMVAESGAVLLDEEARSGLIELLFPRAAVVTPNLHEARCLTGLEESASEEDLAIALLGLGPAAAIVTAGHTARADDLLLVGAPDRIGSPTAYRLSGPRHPDGAAHGSGCTHSSVLAALLAHGVELPDAAALARSLAAEAVASGLRTVGGGAGPVDVIDLSAQSRRLNLPAQ